ncbi:hypothetical protein [Mesobacillus harenae]|uniref:hypothetical protein n=1 Tax=Mesobacillus harenae TaxID=2213203 RepID=UPI0015811868|nr:hypothetical protein [Mesobacillus harenae]
MTSFKSFLALAMFLSLLLVGCSNDIDDNVVASEKTLPSNFHEIAFERETTPLFQFLVRKTVNQSEFEQTWNLYGFESEIPNVDFNEKGAFFIGVNESGSCPYMIKNVELSSDNNTITVPLSEPKGDCTSDATPRTFVVQIDKGISKDIENVVIVQGGVETTVPLETK